MNELLPSIGTQVQPGAKRYRLPNIEREGIAQLSLLETALWPLQGGKLKGSTFETSYRFMESGKRHEANVRVFSPQGLQSIDEYILWGLLGITLAQSSSEATLLATPYWLIKQLGMAMGGFQYDQLRASLERLALAAYQNTGFYNPVSQQHERATLHFFSSFLPTNGRGGDVAADRAWRIEWDKQFFAMCKATGGTLLFDLDLYRDLSPAARRLFLKLKDRFWRSKRVFLNVDDLTINGLGFSAERLLKKRKYDLIHCIRELLDHQVIELGQGQSSPHDLFLRRSKGCYVVVFCEGEYFRQAMSPRATRQKNAFADDPLYEPLRKIGVDAAAIRRLMKTHTRSHLQKWIRITDAAMHEKPQGFPGFKVSPAAFLIDGVQNGHLPPDWIYAHDKKHQQDLWEKERRKSAAGEQELWKQYNRERAQALEKYLQTSEGRRHFEAAFQLLLIFYGRVEPHRMKEAAAEAARSKVEREHIEFPDFSVWVLSHQISAK